MCILVPLPPYTKLDSSHDLSPLQPLAFSKKRAKGVILNFRCQPPSPHNVNPAVSVCHCLSPPTTTPLSLLHRTSVPSFNAVGISFQDCLNWKDMATPPSPTSDSREEGPRGVARGAGWGTCCECDWLDRGARSITVLNVLIYGCWILTYIPYIHTLLYTDRAGHPSTY